MTDWKTAAGSEIRMPKARAAAMLRPVRTGVGESSRGGSGVGGGRATRAGDADGRARTPGLLLIEVVNTDNLLAGARGVDSRPAPVAGRGRAQQGVATGTVPGDQHRRLTDRCRPGTVHDLTRLGVSLRRRRVVGMVKVGPGDHEPGDRLFRVSFGQHSCPGGGGKRRQGAGDHLPRCCRDRHRVGRRDRPRAQGCPLTRG